MRKKSPAIAQDTPAIIIRVSRSKELIALSKTIPNQSATAKTENADYIFAKEVFEIEEGRKPDMNNTKEMNCVAMLQVGIMHARKKYNH